MYADLEKYAQQEDASEKYIQIQNETINTIVSFINSSEQKINETFQNFISRADHEREMDAMAKLQDEILEAGGIDSFFGKMRFLKSLIHNRYNKQAA
jgi:hypothetical protein